MSWASQKLFGTAEATALSAISAGLVMAVAAGLGAFEPFENQALDRLFHLRGATTLRAPITIVEIDATTFDDLGMNWPFPRRIHGEVLERLSAAGAAAIGVDPIFSSPSVQGDADDEALADSARRTRGLVMAAAIVSQSEGVYTTTASYGPIPSLAQAAPAIGYVNVLREADNVVRRAKLDAFEERLPAFAVELYRVAIADGISGAALPRQPNIWINFVGAAGTFPRLSFHRVLQDDFPLEGVRGRIVLIGPTTLRASWSARRRPDVGRSGGHRGVRLRVG
jgi:adenylate cyclase